MPTKPDELDLRESTKRPFGVYVVVALLLLGVFSAMLEIFRVQFALTGFWVEADAFFRRRGGIIMLVTHLFTDPTAITIANGLIIVVWFSIISGLWLMQRWAWVVLMILIGIILTYSLVMYFKGTPDYQDMALYVAIAFYLNDHTVQRAFRRRTPKEATA